MPFAQQMERYITFFLQLSKGKRFFLCTKVYKKKLK
jgi:hypothetical protein